MIYIYILLILFIILLFIPFKIKSYFEFSERPNYKVTITYLFGIFKKEINSTDKIIKVKNKQKMYKIDFINITQYFIEKGNMKKLYFKVNIGIKDPSILGIFIGTIWAITNIVFGYFLKDSNINDIKEKYIQVIPLFDEDIFELFFLCIINVNLVYIITAYIRIIKTRKGGDSIAGTSNRRINENYNE